MRYTTRLRKFTALAELDARDQDIADADLKALSSMVPTLKQISGCQRGYQYKLVVTKWAPGKKQGAPLEKIGWSWKKAQVRPRVRRYARDAPFPFSCIRPPGLPSRAYDRPALPSRAYCPRSLCPLS